MTGGGGDEGASLRFSIVDGMILIGVAALSMAVLKVVVAKWDDWTDRSAPGLRGVELLAAPVLLAWTLVLLLVGSRHRVAPFRRWLRRPGTSACVSALLFGLIGTLLSRVSDSVLRYRLGLAALHASGPRPYLVVAMSVSGCAVAATWAFQALTETWRPAPDRIDRSGRLLGLVLIAFWLLIEVDI